jgi:hypothetical protein
MPAAASIILGRDIRVTAIVAVGLIDNQPDTISATRIHLPSEVLFETRCIERGFLAARPNELSGQGRLNDSMSMVYCRYIIRRTCDTQG